MMCLCLFFPPRLSEREWKTVSGFIGDTMWYTESALTPLAPAPSTSLPARAWPARMKRPVREGMSWPGVVRKKLGHLFFGR